MIGALVALALTYLAGVSSIGGALLAGALAQAGVLTTFMNAQTSGVAGDYVFAISGLSLIITAILAPEGLTGLWRGAVHRLLDRRRAPSASAEPEPEVAAA